MASDSTAGGYEKDMRRVYNGHALFDPHPGYRRDSPPGLQVLNPAVEIGDVGYVKRGAFQLLFNIHRSAEDPRQINGTPMGFYPVERTPPQQWPVDTRGGGMSGRRQFVESSRCVTANFKAQAELPGVGGGSLGFTYKHKHGATLTYFDRHERRYALNTVFYKIHYQQNIGSWMNFIRAAQLPVVEEDVILVTGCEHVRAWATAWKDTGRTGGVSLCLNVQPLSIAGANLSLVASVDWDGYTSTPVLSGPPEAELSSPPPSQLPPPPPPPPESLPGSLSNQQANQCILIVGYRTKQVGKQGVEMKAAAGPHVLPSPDRGADDGPAVLADTPRDPDTSGRELEEFPTPPPSEDNSLLAYALKFVAEHYKPSCYNDMLVMHDDDLKPYLPAPENDIPWDSLSEAQMYLADRFRESPPQCLSRTPAGGWEQRVQDAATILYQVNLEPDGKYTMNAGSVRGVVTGALFAIYPPEAFDTDAIPLAKMVVTVVRAHDSELSIASYTNTPLHSPCVAFQVPANQAAPLHLYISRDTGPSAALSALDEEIACADYPLALSEDESSADLRVSEHGGRLEFTVGNSLGSMASGFKPRFLVAQATHIRPVLQAACHFFRHLRYTPEEHQLRDQITVALHELRIDALLDHSLRPAYQPYGENKLRFDHGNLVTDIMADDKTEYGFTITSQFDVPLHIWAFYFDCSNLTIAEYYRPPEPRGEPSIAKRGALTIGHGSGGGRPFKYFLGSGQNINVGLVKLFITSKPVDLSNILQFSPLELKTDHDIQWFPALEEGTWDTLTITVRQRKPSAIYPYIKLGPRARTTSI